MAHGLARLAPRRAQSGNTLVVSRRRRGQESQANLDHGQPRPVSGSSGAPASSAARNTLGGRARLVGESLGFSPVLRQVRCAAGLLVSRYPGRSQSLGHNRATGDIQAAAPARALATAFWTTYSFSSVPFGAQPWWSPLPLLDLRVCTTMAGFPRLLVLASPEATEKRPTNNITRRRVIFQQKVSQSNYLLTRQLQTCDLYGMIVVVPGGGPIGLDCQERRIHFTVVKTVGL